jgi:hypothetical protein
MSSLLYLIQQLEENLKSDCCTNSLNINTSQFCIKLYNTINDACEENENFVWYSLERIVSLNNKLERDKGIPCHHCDNKKCVISLRIDENENTRFCVIGNMELK